VKHSFRALPSGALLFSIVAHGGSWILLAAIAARGMTQSLDGQVVAWIHLVALGWFSMAALGILIHVIPSFTDLTWRHENVARRSLGAFGAGIALFVTAWLAIPRGAGGRGIAVSRCVRDVTSRQRRRRYGKAGAHRGRSAR
jgi:hypothetical protein